MDIKELKKRADEKVEMEFLEKNPIFRDLANEQFIFFMGANACHDSQNMVDETPEKDLTSADAKELALRFLGWNIDASV